MWNSLIFDSVFLFRFRFRIPDSGFLLLVLPPIVSNMAGVEHAGVKGGKFIVVNHVSETKETTTYEPAESLLFNDSNNQFSFFARLKISCLSCLVSLVSHQPTFCVRPATEHAQCGKLQTRLLTYTVHKSKTLLVQGKAVHVQSTRNSLSQIWEETIQLYIDASTAWLQIEVVHDTLGQEAGEQQEEELNLMADEKSDSDAKDGGTSCFLNNFQAAVDSIVVLLCFSQTCEFSSSKANWRLRFSLPSIILTNLLGNKTLL